MKKEMAMKKFWSLMVVLVACISIAACGTPSKDAAKTHSANVIAIEDNPEMLMKYNFGRQSSEAEGRVLIDHFVVGQSKTPVPVYPPVASAPQSSPQMPPAPPRPAYGRAAKAVPRMPPPAAPCPPPPPQPVFVLPQPQVLATASEGGTTDKHDVAAAIPGAVGNMVGMTTFGTTFGAVQKVGKTVLNNQQAQVQAAKNNNANFNANNNNNAANANAASSAASSAAAAAAAN